MFEYRVTWYNDCYGQEEHVSGLVYGKTYVEAANRVIHDYGEKNIIDLYLQALEDTDTIELDTIKRQFNL